MPKRRRTSAFKRLGLVLVWLGIIALLIPSPGAMPNPSLILLPLGVVLYTIGWIRD
ncbi:hypothetical protein [Natronospirillum operosum]|uniref:hypothetical protein n=1 Tax=Natronospirillum operosum TaxID=2759953 RepID=UPI001436B8D9|nr:hypothetical protein [Natronospirillum operosum]